MLIHYGVGVLLIYDFHILVELLSGIECSRGGDDGDFRVLLLHGVVDDVEPLPELLAAVLVAYSQILEIEWLRMAEGGPDCTPFAVRACVAELNQVEGILYVDIVEPFPVGLRVQRCYVLMARELAGDAVVEHRQRSCAEGLCHKEILVEAHILGGPVAPVVAEAQPLLRSAYGVLPEHLSEIVRTFGSAAAREAHEGRVKFGKSLHHILAERSVLAFVPELGGFRKKGHEIEIENSRGISKYAETAVLPAKSSEAAFVFLPIIWYILENENIGVKFPILVLEEHLE